MNIQQAVTVAALSMVVGAVRKSPKDEHLRRFSDTHEEHYVHFRDLDEVNFPMFSDVTVFVRKEPDEPTPRYYATFACCSRMDAFDRAKGRQLARRRYFDAKNPHRICIGETYSYDVVETWVIDLFYDATKE